MIVNYGLYNVLRTYCPLQVNAQAFSLDPAQVRRAFERAAAAGGDPAVLQREVERRMFERLDYIRCRPHRVLDSGCGVGHGLKLLRRRYPGADLLGIDFAPGVLSEAKREESLVERAWRLVSGSGRFHLCSDFARLPLRATSVDMVWSNLALAWAVDPLAALREIQRVLIAGGLLMFSSYGPDTLKELKAAFGAGSAARHVHSFIDMHDLGDRKSTRLNSSHVAISYAVFCLKKKKTTTRSTTTSTHSNT